MINDVITIVDYGLGNLYSVQRLLNHCGIKFLMADSPRDILNANKILLPGVGAFASGMKLLEQKKFIKPIIEKAKSGTPLLGICLGMQLLVNSSNEFEFCKGLGLIEGKTATIPTNINEKDKRKVPSIGWSSVKLKKNSCNQGLFKRLNEKNSFYFLYSQQVEVKNPEELWGTYHYKDLEITAVIRSKNVMGVQFHPEKSGNSGMILLKNFAAL